MDTHSAPRGDSDATRMVLVVAVSVVGAQLLGYFFPNGNFWGVDAYAFFGPAVMALTGLGLLASIGIVGRALSRDRPADAAASDPLTPRSAQDFWLYPLLAVAGAAMFATFRASHVFLGDGVVLVTTLPLEKTFHPFEPLSLFLEQLTYDAVAPYLSVANREPYEVAWIGAGGLSVLAGAVFLPVAWGLARHLARRVPVNGAPRSPRAITTLVFLVLVCQGYLQVFFGYVEVYAMGATALAIYALTALRFLDDRRSLWPVAVALGLAIALHLSAVVLVPSFAVLAFVAFLDPERKPRRVRDAVLSGVALAALPCLLALLGRGYDLGGTVISLVSGALKQPEPIPGYFGSWRHLRDIANEQLLIGPLALAFFVPATIVALRGRAGSLLDRVFFVTLGVGFAIVCLIAGDSNLGYARNWDLLAPAGFVLALAGLALLLPRTGSPRAARAALALALAVSCFHTVPWIAVNASSTRALKRFTTLPLELGRVESTVGYWYSLRGDSAQAEGWFFRALQENPGNVRAHLNLGDLYNQRGDYRRAARAYRAAIELSPETDEYRLRLIGALVRSRAPAEALPESERLVSRQPKNPRIWTVYGIVLLGNSHADAARKAFDAARQNAPYSLLYRIMVNYVDLPHGYERAVDEVLAVLIGP